MSKKEALRQVRSLLVRLYANQSSIQRVVDDAELDSSQLDLQGVLNDVWHRVLLEAERQKRIGAIIKVAGNDYPESADELIQALYILIELGVNGPFGSATLSLIPI